MSLEKLLEDGWSRHGKEAEQLGLELEAVEQGITSDNLAPYLHLCVHTFGEHLGDWPRALRLGKRILDGRTPTAQTARAWGILYVAAMLADAPGDAARFESSYLNAAGEDFEPALLDMRLMLVDALVAAKRSREAANLYRSALDLAGRIRQSLTLDRTIAVASNNLGWELFELPERIGEEDELMKLCAETSHAFWLRCGNWINEERALYLKAVVANATGDPASAVIHADAALAIIEANDERPLDTERLHRILALARSASRSANPRP